MRPLAGPVPCGHGLRCEVARQLVDAFDDALEHGDDDAREYAVEQLDDFIDEIDDNTDDAVLVALLDLPPDPTSRPLLDQVTRKLARRAGVVEALLGAALGDAPPELHLSDIISVAGAVGALLEAATRNPNVPPRAGNALAILEAMEQATFVRRSSRSLKAGPASASSEPSEMLVDIGEPALERLKRSLRDRDAGPWVVNTLVAIRDGHKVEYDGLDGDDSGADDPGAADSDDVGDDDTGDDASATAAAPTAPAATATGAAHRRRPRLRRASTSIASSPTSSTSSSGRHGQS